MKIKKTKINDLKLIFFDLFKDKRGVFYRNYCKQKLSKVIKKKIVQSNISINKKKFTLRGFHYQKFPSKEGKVITCISGSIFNVTIDLRKNSKSYLQIVKLIISSNKNICVYIPPGCANAFLTLKNDTIIHYLMTDFYKQKNYMRFNYLSPQINIQWPAKPKVISNEDKQSKFLFEK